VWIGEGCCQATVEAFFSDLGEERAGLLTHVSADGADWIHPVVRGKAPQAQICLDAFHVFKWANEKLDELRRRIADELRTAGRSDEAATVGIVWMPEIPSPYATWEYSRIRLPSRSRRKTRTFALGAGGCGRPAGGLCCSARCGLCVS
jgi:transposase